MTTPLDPDFPKGCAIVVQAGWEHTHDGKQFTATLVFPAGPPPNLMFDTVWNKVPVRLVEEKA